MSERSAGATASACSAMREIAIERRSGSDEAFVAEYFAEGPARPIIMTDVMTAWPAFGTWSIEHFAARFGDLLGLIPMTFADSHAGKAVSLKDFWAHLDDPISAIPGFWMDKSGQPCGAPEGAPGEAWSFAWHPFREFPELFDDIREFPRAFGNLVPSLTDDLRGVLEQITDTDLYSVYMSRAGTVTPFHLDFHGTIGSLSQFEGEKTVALMQGSPSTPGEAEGFNPEKPDFDRFPHLAGRELFFETLKPGEMLIIPPNWWHYVRSRNATVTLSHNFFTASNIGQFLSGLLGDIARLETNDLQALVAHLDPGAQRDVG